MQLRAVQGRPFAKIWQRLGAATQRLLEVCNLVSDSIQNAVARAEGLNTDVYAAEARLSNFNNAALVKPRKIGL
jgi:hypothetical protein